MSINGGTSKNMQDPDGNKKRKCPIVFSENASTEELLRLWIPELCNYVDQNNWVRTVEQSLRNLDLPLKVICTLNFFFFFTPITKVYNVVTIVIVKG